MTTTHSMRSWRAGCVGRRTSGSEGGGEEPTAERPPGASPPSLLIAEGVWRTRARLELAIVEYIGWFNDTRLHQALDDRPPSAFERLSQTSTLEISLT